MPLHGHPSAGSSRSQTYRKPQDEVDDDEDWQEQKKRNKPRKKKRPRSSVGLSSGWFENINAGMIGGLLMIIIAVVWFVGGLMGGWLFYYPPILFCIGLAAVVRDVFNRD